MVPRSLQQWVHTLPTSKLHYPDTLYEKFKYYLWRVLTPMHPFTRGLFEHLGIIKWRYSQYRPNGRQAFLLGTLAPHETPQSLATYLVSKGYGNNFIALKDKGELISLRYTPSFKNQYHIRIFEDGEVRGHYELTPECHPYLHDIQASFEPRREYFLELLGDRIIPSSN